MNAINSQVNNHKIVCGDTREAIQSIRHFEPTLTNAELNSCQAAVEAAICGDNEIHEHLTPLGSGAFKLAYELPLESWDWVIKFCSSFNDTEEEMSCLDAAAYAGVSKLFTPTIFFQLDEEASEKTVQKKPFLNSPHREYDEDPFKLWVELQPRVVSCKSLGQDISEASKLPYLNDVEGLNTSLLEVAENMGAPIDWLASVRYTYGDEFLERFERFCNKNDICDLAPDNVGYLDGVGPVIFDWISSSKEF